MVSGTGVQYTGTGDNIGHADSGDVLGGVRLAIE